MGFVVVECEDVVGFDGVGVVVDIGGCGVVG